MARSVRPVVLFILSLSMLAACGGGSTSKKKDTPPDTTPTPPVVVDCNVEWTTPSAGMCDVASGDATLLIRSDVVLPEGIMRHGEVLVEAGAITCVGCDCASQAAAATATTFTCPQALLSPGLINAHDHITYCQMAPVAHDERYDHRHEWRLGLNGKTKLPTRSNPDSLGDAFGEMRQVMGGTTSLFGSGGEAGFLRNLDKANLLEGLTHNVADYSTFPLGDSDGTMADHGCFDYFIDDPVQERTYAAYVPHVSEGIIRAAENEFECMSGTVPQSADMLFETSAFIHGIGVSTRDIALLASERSGLVWSPRSNVSLYGMTADAPTYARFGVPIALGTDWTASGSVNLLRELACAESINTNYWGGYFTDADLVAMVTSTAAQILGYADVIGSIEEGKVADLTLWDESVHTNYAAILSAETQDVGLVLRGGTPLYGETALVRALDSDATDCDAFDVCGKERALCTKRELAGATNPPASTTDLEGALDLTTYGLFFCGVPDNEPSCAPYRPGEYDGVATTDDADGDGIGDAQDNCPEVFNPPRPMDGMLQTDTDGDSVGDACDPCPLNPDTTACSSIDPDDLDGDGVANVDDFCPFIYELAQTDTDGDGIGDDCDFCPTYANPDGQGCLATIYEIKDGTVQLGAAVTILDAVVTATGGNVMFVEVDPNGTDWNGAPYAGLYVYGVGTLPQLGDHLELRGVVGLYHDQIQLMDPTYAVTSTTPTPLDPIVVTPADAVLPEYEGLLVRLENVFVTNTAPTGVSGETVAGEFQVDSTLSTGGLSVDDQFYLVAPWPLVGQELPFVQGVLRYTYARNKLMPRSALDIDLGPAKLTAFGPATSYLYNGQSGAPVPALTVTLFPPPQDDTVVTVTSADPTTLAVTGGGVTVLAGQSTAQVLLEGLQIGGPVTLTATLDTDSLMADVTVLDPAQPALPLSLDGEASVQQSTATLFTLTLQVPAPPGGQLVQIASSGVALTVPTDVTVPELTLSTTFEVTTGTELGSALVSATVGGTTVQHAIEVTDLPPVGLILVEVYYDAPSTDDLQEWVKLYNGTGGPVDLSGYSLGWGGTSYTYGKLQLAGTVPSGGCFIVGGPTSNATNGDVTYDQAVDFNPDIQNGGTDADGVALFDVAAASVTSSTVPIDAVLYGTPGSNANNLLGPDGLPSLVQAPDVVSGSSIVRVDRTTWEASATPNSGGCIVIQ